ncbi:MAG: preQ(1) synthase [Planctomycetota bacterium]
MPDVKLLETFANPKPDRDYVIEHVQPEFTSVCPMTGHPDSGAITIRYVAGDSCLELKALKLYLFSFRNEGHFFEATVNRILDDLVAACKPRRMTVIGDYRGRGGMFSVIRASYPQGPDDPVPPART